MSLTSPSELSPARASSSKTLESGWNVLGAQGVVEGSEIDSRYTFPVGVTQVLNGRTWVVHLSSGVNTACGAWRAGTAEVPAANAEWASTASRWSREVNPYSFCINCHGAKCLSRLGGTLVVAGADLSNEDSESSEDTPSSASSSS